MGEPTQARDPIGVFAAEMQRAADLLATTPKQTGLTSFLQRSLGIGYHRASVLVDALQEAGVLSEPDGNGRRRLR